MDFRELLGAFVLLLGGLSLLQFEGMRVRKLGMFLIWLASGLGTHALSNSLMLAIAMLAAWAFFPLWEIVFVMRQLRVPRHRELTDARPPRDEFEELAEVTKHLVDAGFEQIDECRLQPVEHEQFYRIFIRADGLIQASIGYIAQGPIGFHFVAFTSNSKDGRRWVTWDYPLTYGLVMPPNVAVFRALHTQDATELYEAHRDFLEVNEVHPEDLVASEKSRDSARTRLQDMLNQQIEYNIARGYLARADGSEENFCYSWRGTLYVTGQVIRDLLF